MSSPGRTQIAVEIVANSAENGGCNDGILTQPSESDAAATSFMDHDASKAPPDPSSKPTGSKRRSKLKRSRGSSKSAREIMSSGTAANATTTAAAAGKSASPTEPNSNDNGAPAPRGPVDPTEQARLLSKIDVGTKVEVYSPDDQKYYAGVVTVCPGWERGKNKQREMYTIRYEDGDAVETVNLAVTLFRIVEDVVETVVLSQSAASNPTIACVAAMRTRLETLRQSDDRNTARKILAVLRELDQRSDIDFEALYHTGIGKTVNKLAKSKYGKVREAAMPILQNWKLIDESTPSPTKRAVRMAVNNAADTDANEGEEKGGGPNAVVPKNVPQVDPAPVTPAVRNNNNSDAVDLTGSPSPSKVKKSEPAEIKPPPTKKQRNASVSKITPALGDKESPPSPPGVEGSTSLKENEEVVEVVSGSKKKKKKTKKDRKKAKKESSESKESKQQTVDAKKANKPVAKPATASLETGNQSDVVGDTAKKPAAKSSNAKPDNAKRPASAATATDTQQPPKKKKKRSFNDQILYTMLTSCKAYSIKSLAKATGNTVEGLRHAMLSFLDKKLVFCKEFPSKKGSDREPKKIYWANPMSLAEAEHASKGKKGGGVVLKELSKLLSTPQEIEEAAQERQQLEQRMREIQGELTPLLAIPTMKELDDQIAADETQLKELQEEIQAVKERTANASKPPATPAAGAAYHPANRFRKPPAKPQSPRTLKLKINHMLGEYKSRKRMCMESVENMADAMEKKTKDVVGDKMLALDTDEMEWGQYEDGATGKVYGTAPKRPANRGLLGRKKEVEEPSIVKIPAKYKDV
ncbi:hypothetical protein ACHAXT_006242 [Thalassiosira profunda]